MTLEYMALQRKAKQLMRTNYHTFQSSNRKRLESKCQFDQNGRMKFLAFLFAVFITLLPAFAFHFSCKPLLDLRYQVNQLRPSRVFSGGPKYKIVMNSEQLTTVDPLASVRASCAEVCTQASFVKINDDAIKKLAGSMISQDEAAVAWDFATHYHDGGDLTVQVSTSRHRSPAQMHQIFRSPARP